MSFLSTLFSSPPDDSTSLTDEEKKLYLEAWKKTVEVQQHFNDLSWRIRALGLTALTFTLGATFIAYKDMKPITLLCLEDVSPALIVPVLGILLWLAFWFVDAGWYHRLLIGAVAEGKRLEGVLTGAGCHIGLTEAIGDASPFHLGFLKVRARDKLNIFYVLGGLPLVLAVWFLIVQ